VKDLFPEEIFLFFNLFPYFPGPPLLLWLRIPSGNHQWPNGTIGHKWRHGNAVGNAHNTAVKKLPMHGQD
jgi:hypothetical protein